MKDERKFFLFLAGSLILISSIIFFNILGDRYSEEITSYLERRFYYERVISKKGLSLHRALYWREER